ncbi:hypothetical protein HELRODRAFT_179578 [Helobdella robusta]|uniref:Uncharacterized protein n=1 Tax=Helobdella robusta TaxID=6412 RepID=T1FEW5_HELRO|nr:hypothetical protein HELRODRAFT_179578 [Helobdella robusta]ESN95242.1 hypothetical protein HELRODRAFT_179578 [Helobdella robusta]
MLNTLNKIVVKNRLNDVVSEIVVQYAESNKSISNWYNLKDVNVETFENIAWSRCVTYEKCIAGDDEVELDANNICFGENNGFWQIYFIYKSKNYKLTKPNNEFSLSKDDNKGIMTISLLMNQDEITLEAIFQKGSSNKCFSMIEGIITKRGVNIFVKNELIDQINDLSVTLCETFFMTASNYEDDDDFSSRNQVKLTNSKLTTEGLTYSVEPVIFTYNKHSQYWHMRFSYQGNFYELQTKRKPGIQFNLDMNHHGSDLILYIFLDSKTSRLAVRFEIGDCSKIFTAFQKLKTIDKQMEIVTNKINELNCPQLFHNFSLTVHKLTHVFRTLSRVGYKSFSKEKLFSGCFKRLFYPYMKPEIHSMEMMLENSVINIGKFLLDVEKDDCDIILSALKDAVFYFHSLKKIWMEMKGLADQLKVLVKYFENRKHGEEGDDDDNEFLKSVFHNLDLYDSMQITSITCELLELVAFNEVGICFKISNSEQTHKVSADLGVLALILEDELKVWNQKIVSTKKNDDDNDQTKVVDDEIKHDNPLKDPNIPNESLTSLQIQLIYESSLIKSAELFQIARMKLVDSLYDISSAIHLTNRNVNISMITSSAVGLVGASLVITGLALTPFTAGLSSGLVAAGVGLGASGGALGVGTTIADTVLTQGHLKSTLDLALVDRKVCKSLTRLQDILTQNKLMNALNNSGSFSADCSSSLFHHPQYETKVVGECAANTISNFSVAAVKTGVQIAKNSFLRVGSVTVGVIFDVTSLTFRAINLSKGGNSELGFKIEIEAQDLEKELDVIFNVIEQMGVRIERGGERVKTNDRTPITRPILELI